MPNAKIPIPAVRLFFIIKLILLKSFCIKKKKNYFLYYNSYPHSLLPSGVWSNYCRQTKKKAIRLATLTTSAKNHYILFKCVRLNVQFVVVVITDVVTVANAIVLCCSVVITITVALYCCICRFCFLFSIIMSLLLLLLGPSVTLWLKGT